MALQMPLEMKAFTGSSVSLAGAAGLFFGRVWTLFQIFGHCYDERWCFAAFAPRTLSKGGSVTSLVGLSLQAIALLMTLESKAFTSSISSARAAGLFFWQGTKSSSILGPCYEERWCYAAFVPGRSAQGLPPSWHPHSTVEHCSWQWK